MGHTLMGMIGANLTVSEAGANAPAAGYVVLQRFWMKNGTQVGRIHDYVSKGLLPRRTALGCAR